MRGTISLAARTRKTCQALNIRLKLEAEEMVVMTDTSKYQTKIAVGIGRFLTQKVIRPQKLDSHCDTKYTEQVLRHCGEMKSRT
jgi:hypothetical protein